MTPTNISVIASLPHRAGLSIFYKMHRQATSYVKMAVPP